MSSESAVSAHYTHGGLLEAIESSLRRLGKLPENVTVEDLGPVDEFHIGGRGATQRLLQQLDFSKDDHILDVGCGLGGTTRFIADTIKSRATGIDLTKEYVDVGNLLSSWVGLDGLVTLRRASATSMPFDDAVFDGAVMLHVAMNIEDKARLFEEVHRVLRPGGSFGIYDIMRIGIGALSYPVPWAADEGTSQLATPAAYSLGLQNAGFEIAHVEDRRQSALEFFDKVRKTNEANGGPPILSLHTLMQDAAPLRLGNMIDGITAGAIAPCEIVAVKA